MNLRWCVLILTLFLAGATAAQDKKVVEPADSAELNTQAYIQLLREDIQAKREAIIREGMQLDEKQALVLLRQEAGEIAFSPFFPRNFIDRGKRKGQTPAPGTASGSAKPLRWGDRWKSNPHCQCHRLESCR